MNQIYETIKYWEHVEYLIIPPKNDKDHKKFMDLLCQLMQLSREKKHKNKTILSLLKVIGKSIQEYEEEKYPREKPTQAEMLDFLMDQHSLKQKDLPEIGSQTLISRILSGERKLTVDQIKKLSKRFHVSPAVFF